MQGKKNTIYIPPHGNQQYPPLFNSTIINSNKLEKKSSEFNNSKIYNPPSPYGNSVVSTASIRKEYYNTITSDLPCHCQTPNNWFDWYQTQGPREKFIYPNMHSSPLAELKCHSSSKPAFQYPSVYCCINRAHLKTKSKWKWSERNHDHPISWPKQIR